MNTRKVIAVILSLIVLFSIRLSTNSLATSYYVSSSQGTDSAGGEILHPFQTISKVNSLALLPGDEVLFKCGDTWNGEMLIIRESGSSDQAILFGSYPTKDCVNRPVFSGSLPIDGWSIYSGNIYEAHLASGNNEGLFNYGINQLFRNGIRLAMGRWPNIESGNPGYSFVDAQPESNKLTDTELPLLDWTGGVMHIMGMRWYFLNRIITATEGKSLSLNQDVTCWNGCDDNGGWGYFINNNLNTLDKDGEWYYDELTKKVYLYSTSGVPLDIEGSVLLKNDARYWGIITLGEDYNDPIAHVSIDNFEIINGFRNAISTPTNYAGTELHDVVIRNCLIRNMDETGIKLSAWVYSATDGRPDGWRGGYDLVVANNDIRNVNHYGIDLFSRDSEFSNNRLEQVGIMNNANKSGIGCGYTGEGGQCTEAGDGIRIKIDKPADSGNYNQIQGNHLFQIGYNGIDVFGHNNNLLQNVIREACSTKADCGAIRTFGRDSLASSSAYDITLDQNIIVEPLGNVDAANNRYNQENFAFGLYVDNYSRNVVASNNTLIRVPSTGLLYQRSSGVITGNTLYDCSRNYGRSHVSLSSDVTSITSFSQNTLYGIGAGAKNLSIENNATLMASDFNHFFHPFLQQLISVEGAKTFAQWQTYSGMDSNSTTNLFTLSPGELPISEIFVNDSESPKTYQLKGSYVDLDQNPVQAPLILAPYTSKIILYQGPDLTHCIAALQLLTGISGIHPSLTMIHHDLDSDGKYGLADVVGMLQQLSEH